MLGRIVEVSSDKRRLSVCRGFMVVHSTGEDRQDPSLGLHHSHDNNAMRLVDDLMEPFRPDIDLTVWRMQVLEPCVVNADTKRTLVQCLYQDLATDVGRTPMLVSVQKLT